FGHRTDRVLDRHRLVDAVLVVEVDVVDAEARERRFARSAHVLGLAVDPDPAAVLATLVAELRREHDLLAATLDGAADELLVDERRVHGGGAQQRPAKPQRALDRRDRLAPVGAPVELAHAHTAQPKLADAQSLPKCARLHRFLLRSVGGAEALPLRAT